MKSLKKNQIVQDNPEIFTPEIVKYILEEGFGRHSNNSYCYKGYMDNSKENIEWQENCYFKNIEDSDGVTLNVYIFKNGIGVDVDYDCGGNLNYSFYQFSQYSFEKAYDMMVDKVNGYR